MSREIKIARANISAEPGAVADEIWAAVRQVQVGMRARLLDRTEVEWIVASVPNAILRVAEYHESESLSPLSLEITLTSAEKVAGAYKGTPSATIVRIERDCIVVERRPQSSADVTRGSGARIPCYRDDHPRRYALAQEKGVKIRGGYAYILTEDDCDRGDS